MYLPDITAHADEISYLYNYAGEANNALTLNSKNEIVEKDDVAFSKAFIKSIVSFADTGLEIVQLLSNYFMINGNSYIFGLQNSQNLCREILAMDFSQQARTRFWSS